jgi:crotonobetainyl-CoA:carnitine CoA-transferase CaiB-like acyl-CoA transferase
LHGIRILDLTSMGTGSNATGFMADLGTGVVKIESPLGDPACNVGSMRNAGMGATFCTSAA